MAGRCSVRVLGGFSVEIDGRSVPESSWRHRRAADLVKILSLTPGHRAPREQLMEMLWPDLSPSAATANLRKATFFARKALGSEDAIAAEAGVVALWPSGELEIDAERFSLSASDALQDGNPSAAAALYGGELLPDDRYAEWATAERARLRDRFVQVVRAGELWERVLEIEPADEEAHRALMQQYLDAGNRPAAMRQFERLRERLRADLGVGADPETVSLYEKILAYEGAEPASAAERARALVAWGLTAWNRQNLEEAERLAMEARALAIEAELGREVGEASALLGLVSHARGAWRETFANEFGEWIKRSPTLAAFFFDANLCLAEFSLYGPNPEEVERLATELLASAHAAGSTQGEAIATLMIGEMELFGGKVAPAIRTLSAAARLNKAAQMTSGSVLSELRLAEAHIAAANRSHAARIAARGRRAAPNDPLAPHLIPRAAGVALSAAPDPKRALAILETTEAETDRAVVCEPCSMGFRIAAATTLARAGETSRARGYLDTAERVAGMWQGGPWLAAVWEGRAELRRADGDHARAAALFTEAADLFGDARRPLDEARCRAAAAL